MTRAEVRRIRRQQRKLTPVPAERPIPVRIREGMLVALDALSRQNDCDYLVEIHKQLAEAARNGNIAAAREIFDRLEGRPTQAIDLRRPGQDADDIAEETLRKMPRETALRQLDMVAAHLEKLRQEIAGNGAVTVKALPEAREMDTAGPKWGTAEAEWPETLETVDVDADEGLESGAEPVKAC